MHHTDVNAVRGGETIPTITESFWMKHGYVLHALKLSCEFHPFDM